MIRNHFIYMNSTKFIRFANAIDDLNHLFLQYFILFLKKDLIEETNPITYIPLHCNSSILVFIF